MKFKIGFTMFWVFVLNKFPLQPKRWRMQVA